MTEIFACDSRHLLVTDCLQVITPELNRAVVELLIKVRDFQREQDQHVGGDQNGGSDGNASGENGDAIADQVCGFGQQGQCPYVFWGTGLSFK